jgi:hypothetical protein
VGSREACRRCVSTLTRVPHATIGSGDRRAAALNSLQLVDDVCGREPLSWRVYQRAGRKRVAAMPLKVVRRRFVRPAEQAARSGTGYAGRSAPIRSVATLGNIVSVNARGRVIPVSDRTAISMAA